MTLDVASSSCVVLFKTLGIKPESSRDANEDGCKTDVEMAPGFPNLISVIDELLASANRASLALPSMRHEDAV